MSRIPKVIHYCFGMAPDFGGKPWSLVHHVCVLSAIKHIEPDQVFFYCAHEPYGAWWELTRELLTVVRIEAPEAIFSRPLLHPAHKADVIRIEKLIELGGIYLDADVLVHRSFDPLLGHSTVLGMEGIDQVFGVANAVIVAERDAPFLKRWYETYRSFRGTAHGAPFWNEHSVEVPAKLARQYPNEVTVLPPKAFYWPLWTTAGLKQLYGKKQSAVPAECFANHLWESAAWRYLEDLTPGEIRRRRGNFYAWALPYVEGLPNEYGRPSLRQRVGKKLSAVRDRLEAIVGKLRANAAPRFMASDNRLSVGRGA